MTPVSGGAVVVPRMVYPYNVGGVNQLAALLPCNVRLGSYDLRV